MLWGLYCGCLFVCAWICLWVQDDTRALFSLGSKLVHSCIPNTHYSPTEGLGRHMALAHIKKGDIVTTSHLGLLHIESTPRRRAHLYKTRLLVCSCPRCSGPDLSRQLPCPHCHPRDPKEPTVPEDVAFERKPVHYVVCTLKPKDEDCPPSPDAFTASWTCQICARSFPDTKLGFDLDMERQLQDRVIALDPSSKGMDWDELMQWFMACLHTLGRRHWLVVKVYWVVLEGEVEVRES